ncbi:MAG: tetratricopeptide repeat protein [Pseudodesulfovibrio sp.]|uniref:Tetratricopeptide TPR_1 repeat-containing protein n=2 Tax=Desulfovibrionaceae TaxID=194924 RepID=E6VY15_PSEA9|nr:Tetratricopeptide TPR_1 repeat-containing protein [Pseudodesulfovibrio aespoeensis Aspo-2]MBU4191210.1 tetratricopeptide repeat protein [Pseudomonadota bacterium]MBV1763956.1 tetratricopeptide repeat protein [Pseudodesulfovibrio sp.]MBU4244299.1 tetratricopeptide repeat protein [Pseudomonadota bacterium]MBU4377617.1 tetratricopeptide repeat protein [Pseudomonadota bacterium]
MSSGRQFPGGAVSCGVFMEDARIHTGADGRTADARRGCTGLDNPDEPLKCVFSTVSEIKVGTGTTAKKQRSKLLWYVQQCGFDQFGVRKINPQFVPVGDERIIDQEALLTSYTPEVEIHNTRVEPAMIALKKTIVKGDKHREKGEPLSAEMEYAKALDVDETNVRAIFGLGLVYLGRSDKKNSRTVFEQLLGLHAAFSEEHKHLFNEFGIQLRKSGLFDEAVQYYSRAVELTEADENLYYNLARAFYEKNDWEHSVEFAARSLSIKPDHDHSLNLCKVAVALAGNDDLRARYGKPPVPDAVARKAGRCAGIEPGADEMTIEISPAGVDGRLSSSSLMMELEQEK